jgi:hypothetical protein
MSVRFALGIGTPAGCILASTGSAIALWELHDW